MEEKRILESHYDNAEAAAAHTGAHAGPSDPPPAYSLERSPSRSSSESSRSSVVDEPQTPFPPPPIPQAPPPATSRLYLSTQRDPISGTYVLDPYAQEIAVPPSLLCLYASQRLSTSPPFIATMYALVRTHADTNQSRGHLPLIFLARSLSGAHLSRYVSAASYTILSASS